MILQNRTGKSFQQKETQLLRRASLDELEEKCKEKSGEAFAVIGAAQGIAAGVQIRIDVDVCDCGQNNCFFFWKTLSHLRVERFSASQHQLWPFYTLAAGSAALVTDRR
jgi:hypothetical protein